MTATEHLDVAVIGAGVIGLAVSRALAIAGREVVVLDAERAIGTHTSSRNSEVIHAGIYYPTGSLKASLCVQGKNALYKYCAASDVAHARIGKMIVATRDEEVPVLERILAQATANGVTDLAWLSASEARDLEPAVTCVRALLSPSTGIIDSHGFMGALKRDGEQAGSHVVLSTPVVGGRIDEGTISLHIGGPEPSTLTCNAVINAAGLRAQAVASRLSGLARSTIPATYFAKGHYFMLRGKSPVSRLVYPVPVPGGLGIHITLDLAGQARLGPDVSWVDDVDYSFDESRGPSFFAATHRYLPSVVPDQLTPGYTGIRPKLGPPEVPAHDFVIQGPGDHGVPGLVNLYGIESPGLTAALAIAELVEVKLRE